MSRIATFAAVALALFAVPAAAAQDPYHDETTSQHVGRTTSPAYDSLHGGRIVAPTDDDMRVERGAPPRLGTQRPETAQAPLHDETTNQHVGRSTTPAMGHRPDAVTTIERLD